MELAGKAVLAALADAGLTVDDLDGFALYSMGFDTSLFAQWLGVPEVRFTALLTGGGGGVGGLGRAGVGRDRERHGRVRRVGDDAPAGGEPLRRVVRATRQRRARCTRRRRRPRGASSNRRA